MVKCGGIKELVGNIHESRRVEETSEGGQDSLWVVVPMMMMMIMVKCGVLFEVRTELNII
jgi:hypothetical protein